MGRSERLPPEAPHTLLATDTQGRASEHSGSQILPPPSNQADMPLPALPAPPPVQPDPVPLQTKLSDPPAAVAPAPPPRQTRFRDLPAIVAPAPPPHQTKFRDLPAIVAPASPPQQPAETPKRQPRATAAASRAPKSYYMEKYLEQGEYHYRRRLCEPPNMPDVCFMPQSDRQPIVVVAKP